MIAKGKNIAVISIGHIGNMIIDINADLKSQELEIGHYDIRFLKPLDENLLHTIFKNYKYIITLEDGCLSGGMGVSYIRICIRQ